MRLDSPWVVKLSVDPKSLPPCLCPEDVGRNKDHLIDLEDLKFAFSGMLAFETGCSRAPNVWGIHRIAALQPSPGELAHCWAV